MSEPLTSYLRSRRKLSGLTQTEVAYVLEAEGAQTISRLEREVQTPDLVQAFALAVLFEVSTEELFLGLHRSIEMRTQNNAYLLEKLLADDPDDELKKQKLRTLRRVYGRALRDDLDSS
jgi:DNA-binding XRE family transcriptional regulator